MLRKLPVVKKTTVPTYLNILRDNYRISEAANDYESAMVRRNELHVKAGSARQQQYAGKQR
jgi:hypothetical protein